ncbi:MAG: DUF3048 domain-containing protein, partial [Acidimicrobiales bacterium]
MSQSNKTPSHKRPRGSSRHLLAAVSHLTTGQKVAAGAATAIAIVIALVLVANVVFTSGARVRDSVTSPRTTSRTVSTSSVPKAKAKAKVDSHLCPLTGEPAPGGKVPQRPAIGVKIGNDPASRPQTGLPTADIVYEEMAEGGITRYLAVYQCHAAPVIGPVRSVRWDDWHVLSSYGHPILSFSGGIQEWNNVVAHLKWLFDANGSFYPTANAYYRTSNRVAPWNYYTSTAALWKLDPKMHTPPPAQFRYSPAPAKSAAPVSSVTIPGFAGGLDVTWKWDAATKVWERFVGGQPDTDISGQQLHATNVVIQMVRTYLGPYPESGTVGDTCSITKGSGVVYVFRDGKVERGT